MSDAPNRHRLPIAHDRPIADTPLDARQATPPQPTPPLRPPDGAPNVLEILIDDMGFGASSP